ncbi:MAG: fused MFS/spermidine synthase [Patescibacteria group bacterium]|nr:fused MFS/spermidine synthase [Patescibacteria group bacterium]
MDQEEQKKDTSTVVKRGSIEAHAYVFTASFCLMVIELVAGRIMAPYLGSSLYTWTSVIGVVLTGITLGNYVGGVLAERGARWKSVATLFAFAGFALAVSFYTYSPTSDFVYALGLPMPMATFIFSFVGFFPMSILLSMITPIVITLSLTSLKKTGTTVGRIYAVSAAASIAGTFAAGYVLIPLLGVKTIVLIVSAVLLLAGILASRGGTAKELAVKVAVLLLWASFLTPKFCLVETAYYCISVDPAMSERGYGHRLILDRLTHSFVFNDPDILEYDYETVYGVVTEYAHRRLDGKRPLRTLSIGGGGYTMPKYVVDNYSGAQVDVVEIDPMVTETNVKHLGLNPYGDIRTYNQDARMFMAHGADGNRYDVIFGDAFNDYSIPYHLTTVEFLESVRDTLTPGGIYAMNSIDDFERGRVLASFLRTVGEVFPYVEVSPMGHDWKKVGRNTFIIFASFEPFDRYEWNVSADSAFADHILSPYSLPLADAKFLMPADEMSFLVSDRKGILLTDNYAPVDSLTAPLFSRRQ